MSEEVIQNIGEGLYVAALGMGLVFFSLLTFLFVLVVIRRIFPDDSLPEGISTDPNEATLTSEEIPIQQIYIDPPQGSITGEKLAAIAVSIYLQMEEQEKVQNPDLVLSGVGDTELSEVSNWKVDGRNTFMNNQGQRPSQFRQRSRSNYQQRRGI